VVNKGKGTLPIWPPDSKWRPSRVQDLPTWEGATRIGIDTETCDPHLKDLGIGVRRGGYVAGVSFAIEDGPCHYLPIRHQGGDNLDPEQVLAYLQDQAKGFRGDIVGANLPYDLDYLGEEGVHFTQPHRFRDVQIADPLIYELHDSYSLQSISERWGLPGKDITVLEQAAKSYGVDPKSGLWKLPARYVGVYAEQDARLPLQLLRRQERKLEDLNLWEIYELESKVIPILVKLRRRGILIDEDKLQQIEEWSLTEEAKAISEIRRASGCHVVSDDLWKSRALAPVLEKVGITVGLTKKGEPSVDKHLLVHADHPAASAILQARKVNKLRTTFAASVRDHITNGRLHCTLNQIARESEVGGMKGARFGRLSSSNPNLQQQPSRDEFAAMWRSIYKPEPGTLWACNDYSQQEPRWITHFANITNCTGAAEAAKKYHEDPNMDNHQFMADVIGWPGKDGRTRAKTIFLGLGYGEGGAKLCDDQNLPTRWAASRGRGPQRQVTYHATEEEADAVGDFYWRAAGEEGQSIIDQFNARVPFVQELANRGKELVQRRGYIVTIGRRRLNFPRKNKRTDGGGWSPGKYDWAHKALNRLIQGSSADQVKAAMVELDRDLPEFWIQLQVHDEIDGSVETPEIAHKGAEIMADCISATVPFRVDVELGPSWGELK